MGDGTEGRGRVWHRPVRKADLELVLRLLPHIYAINPIYHTLRQLAREIRARQAVPTAEGTLIEALKVVNDKVGFLVRVEPYYATKADEQNSRPSAWFYECVGDLASAIEKVKEYSAGKYKTPLFGAQSAVHGVSTARLEDFVEVPA